MGLTIDKCRTCKYAFTLGKDRWYCNKSLADKDDCRENKMTIEEVNERLHKDLDKIPSVEAIPKAEYEARLKADMVAMLEEINLQFDEICFYKNMGEWKTVPEIKAEYKAIIQEKINEYKAESEE